MEAQSREKGGQCCDVVDGAIVRSDIIVQIHADIVKVRRNKSHDCNEPGGSAGGALGHAKPFVKARQGAGRC